MAFFVYIIRSEISGTVYKGCCENFEKRLRDHNAGRVKSTKHRRPWNKHYIEEFTDKRSALKRERYFKSRSGYRWLKQNGII
jgi:putative endonuclease